MLLDWSCLAPLRKASHTLLSLVIARSMILYHAASRNFNTDAPKSTIRALRKPD
jgi:hypothetical protein